MTMTMNTGMVTIMHILYYNAGEDPATWLPLLEAALPEASIREWKAGDDAPADYALVFRPPPDMLTGRTGLKAILNLAAGVDALLDMDTLPEDVPIIRLEDAGMDVQMAEYVTHAVLRYFRHFDAYDTHASRQEWHPLEPTDKTDFTIGILGLGVMGKRVAEALLHFGFPVRGWSRSRRRMGGIRCFAGMDELDAFLQGLSVLVCLLPLTQETAGILDMRCFSRLRPAAFLINAGRGAHLVETDLLTALDSGQLRAATLDVMGSEPLPSSHPFWRDRRITITPHIAARTLRKETIAQVAEKLRRLEENEEVGGVVDRKRGY